MSFRFVLGEYMIIIYSFMDIFMLAGVSGM